MQAADNPARALTLADLATAPRWVVWRTEQRNDTGRVTKVPRDASTLREASSTRPETWATRDKAQAADAALPASSHGPGGVGVILGSWQDGLAIGGVDLDSCRDPATGAIEPWAREVLAMLNTYAEVSPSGTGIKALFVMDGGAVQALRDARLIDSGGFGRSFKRNAGAEHPPAIEVHLGGRYYAVTDDRLPDAPAEYRPVPTATLAHLLGATGPAFAGRRPPPPAVMREAGAPDALLARLHDAMAFNTTLAQRWSGDTAGLADASASALALSLGGALKRSGFSYAEMCHLLRQNPHTAAWTATKGEPQKGRELRRIWERTGDAGEAREPWPVVNLALATADTLPAPPLPLAVFPGRWQGWIERAAQRAGAPPDYVACSLLAVVGACIGNARWASPWEGWSHPPVLNVACIGTPSTGKSPGMEAAEVPLAELAGDLNDDWEARQREYRTARQAAKEVRAAWEAKVKAAIKKNDPPPLEPTDAREPDELMKRRVVDNAPTMEAARDLSAANPRGLLLYRDELSGWIAGMGRYGNGDAVAERGFWLQAHGGGRWAAARVKDGARAKDGDNAPEIPHLSWGVLGGFQPDRLASVLLAGDDDGLAARFIFTWPAPLADVSDPPDGRALPFDLKATLRRYRELPMPEGKPEVLPFDDDAIAMMQDWRRAAKAMEGSAAGQLLSWVGKLPGFAVRLAVIFSHMAWTAAPDGTPPPEGITRDDLARAVRFLSDYAVPMARRAFGEASLPEAERDARRLARWLLRRPQPRPETLNARELRRMADGPGIATPARIEAALAELAELGWVKPARARAGDTAGRKRGDWAVNPVVRAGAS